MIYFKDKPVFLGGKMVYKSEGIAKKRIIQSLFGQHRGRRKEAIEAEKLAIEDLIKEGTLKFVTI